MNQAPTPAGSENDIYANPPDVTELELEPGHPGLGDEAYIQRRRELFALCREHRLKRLGPPLIAYTHEEQRIWREVSPRLDALHVQHASSIYLQAKRDLGISENEIPQLRHLSARIEQMSGMHLVPAEGPIPYRTFYSYIAERGFPVTQFIRHGSKPEFTPEPDMIHDCLGHVPPLVNPPDTVCVSVRSTVANPPATGMSHWSESSFGAPESTTTSKLAAAGVRGTSPRR
jgi:hypothetical protein